MIVEMKCPKCHQVMEFIESILDQPCNETTMTGYEVYYCDNCNEEKTRNVVYTLTKERWE